MSSEQYNPIHENSIDKLRQMILSVGISADVRLVQNVSYSRLTEDISIQNGKIVHLETQKS